MSEPDIHTTTIGIIDHGIDGRDEHVLLTRLDDDLDPDFAHEWMLPQVYRECLRPGGYFCTSLTVVPLPSGNECIAIIHHQYDV